MSNTAPVMTKYDLDGRKIVRIYEFDKKRGRASRGLRLENHGEQLKETLMKHGFEVEHHLNLEEDEIKEDLRKVAEGSEELALFWAFIFSNYDSEYIPCYKGAVGLKELWKPFTVDRCQILFGKPKLFFIQADIVEQDPRFMPLMNIVNPEPVNDGIIRALPVSSDIMLAQFRRHKRDKNFSIGRFISEELSRPETRNMNQIMTSILGRRWSNAPKFSSTFCKQLYLPPKTVSPSDSVPETLPDSVPETASDSVPETPSDSVLETPSDSVPESSVDTSLKQYNTCGKRKAYSFVFKTFKNVYELPGAVADKKAIEDAMKARGFIYEDCNKDWNLTAKSFIEKLEEIAENKENADFVMIFVSTHGTSDHKLYAYDGTINMHDLWTAFTKNDGYKGKPKVFIVDACRGVTGEEKVLRKYFRKGNPEPFIDEGEPTPINAGDQAICDDSLQRQQEPPSDGSDEEICCQQEVEEKDEKDEGGISKNADLFIGLSTVNGKLTLQCPEQGSPYMQDLCSKLTKLKGERSLFDIMVSANNEIAQIWGELVEEKTNKPTAKGGEFSKPEFCTQMPTFTSSLRADICIS